MTDEQLAVLRRLDRLAYWLDDRFRLPGTNIRVGLDGLVGLVPGIGDTVTGAFSVYLMAQAWRLGLPAGLRTRMLGNVLVDLVVGSVPVLGDVFDIGWKANLRNVELLRTYLQDQR